MKNGTQTNGLNVLDVLILLFAGSVCLSTFVFNHAPLNATKLRMFALLIVLYFVFRLVFQIFRQQHRKVQTVFCFILVLSGLVEAVWGLRQLYGFSASQHALFKLTGSFFNPGPYAGYLAVVTPLAVYFGVKGERLMVKVMAFLTCAAIMLVLPAAMSRASWLAALAGSAVVMAGLTRHPQLIVKQLLTYFGKWRVKPAMKIGIVALLLSAAFFGMYFLKKNSADGRLLTWKISLQTLAHHPLGAGLGNFSGAYGEMQANYFASDRASETERLVAGNPEYGFNEYLQIGIESGIVSLLWFIAVLIQAFRLLRRKKDWGAMGSLTALLVFACFSYPFSIAPFLIVFVFLLATSGAQWNADLRRIHLRSIVFACSCLFVSACCICRQYPVYRADKTWNEKRMYYQSGLYREVVQSYELLYPYLNDRIQFLFEYGRSLSNTGHYEASNKVFQRAMQISCDPMLYNIMGKNYQAMKTYSQAEACFIRATQLVPSRLYPWYLLAKLYNETGLTDKACETAKIVLTKEVKVQSPAVREMREEVRNYCFE